MHYGDRVIGEIKKRKSERARESEALCEKYGNNIAFWRRGAHQNSAPRHFEYEICDKGIMLRALSLFLRRPRNTHALSLAGDEKIAAPVFACGAELLLTRKQKHPGTSSAPLMHFEGAPKVHSNRSSLAAP
jgi:hypothetical protein